MPVDSYRLSSEFGHSLFLQTKLATVKEVEQLKETGRILNRVSCHLFFVISTFRGHGL
jgi:hypothetical protein